VLCRVLCVFVCVVCVVCCGCVVWCVVCCMLCVVLLVAGRALPKALSRMRDRFCLCCMVSRLFQLATTSSQERSVRSRYKVGILGLLDAKVNPLCLKETISPGCGFHLLANSAIKAEASNRTPFALHVKHKYTMNEEHKKGEKRLACLQLTHPSACYRRMRSNDPCLSVSIFLYSDKSEI